MQDSFNPNGVGVKGSLFGLPFSSDEADIVIIPVPWDVTVSYGEGTALAPQHVLEASSQIDYEIPGKSKLYETKVALSEIPEMWLSKDEDLRPLAADYIDWLEQGQNPEEAEEMSKRLIKINAECAQLMDYVEQVTLDWKAHGKKTILLGGDHSAPPHASIMHNVLQEHAEVKLVQVGIRDYCEEERLKIEGEPNRIITFFDNTLKKERFEGISWQAQCDRIIAALPQYVYISIDIDVIDPAFAPATGNPEPGGLTSREFIYLISRINKMINLKAIDLVEINPDKDKGELTVKLGAKILAEFL